MKKIPFVFLAVLLSFCQLNGTYSQSKDSIPISRKGHPVLPEEGDFAIGISATPVFSYVGNLMLSDGNNTLLLDLLDNQFYGRYMLKDQLALRMRFRISRSMTTLKNPVPDQWTPMAEDEDILKQSECLYEIMPGLEFRYGKRRLQAVYGAELSFRYQGEKNVYDYGNGYASAFPDPVTTIDFIAGTTGNAVSRVTEYRLLRDLSFGCRVFTGLEYFLLPKISLGMEVGLGFSYGWYNRMKSATEFWDFSQDEVATLEDIRESSPYSRLSTDILDGNIVLMFYF